MKLTNFNNNISTLFLPLTMILGLLLLAEYATAEFCCYVGGCGGNTHCNPCKAMASCGQYDPCGSEGSCSMADEGGLSTKNVAAEARKLRQDVVEWRSAEQALEGRKAEGNPNEHEGNNAHQKRDGHGKANAEEMEA